MRQARLRDNSKKEREKESEGNSLSLLRRRESWKIGFHENAPR